MKNKKNDLISIIITCYNRGKYLRECLDSVLAQNYTNFEALVIDDGSTDDSLSILQEYAAKDSRIKALPSKHVGFPQAKNIGLDNASGDWIIFLDADDSVYPYWLLLLHETAVRFGSEIAACGFDSYHKEKAPEKPLQQILMEGVPVAGYTDDMRIMLLFSAACRSYMWNKLVRKELYEGIRHQDQLALSDLTTMHKIFAKANKIMKINLPLVHYRQHEESMSYTTHQKPAEYSVFRLGVYRDLMTYLFDKYPQAQFIMQIVLRGEVYDALAGTKNDPTALEKVKKIIEELKPILTKPCMRFVL